MSGLLSWWLWMAVSVHAGEVDLVDEALERIDEQYLYDGVPRELLEEAAVLGMVAMLNELQGLEVNAVLTAEARALREDAIRGSRRGFGFEYSLLVPHGFRITRVFPGSSADQAGLRKDDLVVALNGKALAQLSAERIRSEMRRAAPAPMKLTIINRGERRMLTVVPRPYQVDPVWREDVEATACLRISHFAEDAATGLARELMTLREQPLVLDLRDNPGGILEEARAAADLFLPKGAVAGTVSRKQGGTAALTMNKPPVHEAALAILVNQGTTGAAEWFALALQQAHPGNVWVVGTPTAGVDTGTSFVALTDEVSLELTTEAWTGPDDQGWSATGVVPDVLVPPSVLLPTDPHAPLPDPPLERATRLLDGSSGGSP